MKILSVGNSFSVDAHRYIPAIAREAHLPVSLMNLYIGGCSLERHHRNMQSGERAYELFINGEQAFLPTSIKDALLATNWDVITLQQASHFSIKYETYAPYLVPLAEYIRTLCPGAKLYIHETWAYEAGSKRLCEELGYTTPEAMTRDACACYRKAAEAISADGIIPCGTAMQTAIKRGISPMHRDTFHADLAQGRLLLGATWLTTLFARSLVGTPLPPHLDAPCNAELWQILLSVAEDAAKQYGAF